MTVKGGTSQACAACKYQRRKCSADCPLAPYFPPDQPKMFQNAHRLFGVSNILKILKQLSPAQKEEAMRSIIYESYAREKHPVHGCYGIILELNYNINQAQLKLEAINAQLNIYRHQHQIQSPPPHHSPSSHLQLGNALASNALPLFQQHPQQHFNNVATGIAVAPQHHDSFSNGSNATGYNTSPAYIDSKESITNSLWVQHPSLIPLMIDSHIFDSKDAYESSSESSMKETKQPIEHVAENELKSAAACFSLTSVN